MKIIFAQGNPGKQYERTRHNSGFMVVDTLAAKESAPWHTDTKFKADIAEVQLADEKVLLVKPLSYYNETGQVARSVIDFYKVDPSADLLVIHDELALPFGTIRVREKGVTLVIMALKASTHTLDTTIHAYALGYGMKSATLWTTPTLC